MHVLARFPHLSKPSYEFHPIAARFESRAHLSSLNDLGPVLGRRLQNLDDSRLGFGRATFKEIIHNFFPDSHRNVRSLNSQVNIKSLLNRAERNTLDSAAWSQSS